MNNKSENKSESHNDDHSHATLDEILALKQQFEKIKSETEHFIAAAKELSDRGLNDAKDLIESAKDNWQSIIASFGVSSLSNLFGKVKSPIKKKTTKSAAKSSSKSKKAKKPGKKKGKK